MEIKTNFNKYAEMSRVDRKSIIEKKSEEERKWLAQQVRNIGESLIKNAENIVGTDTYRGGLDIFVTLYTNEEPTIRITREFYPERNIK